jgi:hypothetical protein
LQHASAIKASSARRIALDPRNAEASGTGAEAVPEYFRRFAFGLPPKTE